MSKPVTTHPEDGVLLRYIDGELAARKARQVERHLQACWTCRTEVEELQATIADCVRYRKQVLAQHLPEAPKPWTDLYREFDRMDAQTPSRWFAWRGGFRWAATCAMAALATVVIYYELRQTPSVKAAELLHRAVAVSQAHPARKHHVRVQSSRGLASAQPLFETARYDSADPLTAQAFQTWRDKLSEKTDEIAESNGMVHLRTSTVSGAVSAASLTLRESDLEPVEGRLEFRDQQWIEFTEITEPPSTEAAAIGSAHVGVPPRPAVPSRLAAIVPGSTASISSELQVFAALHGVGADLGDPVQVSLNQGTVRVSGVGIGALRQQQIRSALNAMPNVVLEFTEAANVAPADRTAPQPTATAVSPAANPFEARLEALLGGRVATEKFASQVLDWNEAAMARVYAIRTLAQRFPSDADLSESDRAVLRTMATEDAAALAGPLVNLERTMTTVLVRMGAAEATASAPSAATWQASAQEVFRAARRVDTLSSLLLGIAPGDNAKSDLPSQLLKAVVDFRADLDQCQRLLRQ